ncbi:MAG: hypothetical protein ABSF95_08915 [Verrucomicrobiota bacterium]|jgi:hypothetical protein
MAWSDSPRLVAILKANAAGRRAGLNFSAGLPRFWQIFMKTEFIRFIGRLVGLLGRRRTFLAAWRLRARRRPAEGKLPPPAAAYSRLDWGVTELEPTREDLTLG